MNQPTPFLLCILDGWGHHEASEHNAIAQAATPNWDALWRDCPHTTIDASEHYVGLPKGQMGNSEVGHMNIGSGRPVRQLLPRINEAIEDDKLRQNAELLRFITTLKESGGTCHLMGLCSDGGVHAHIRHIMELATILAGNDVPVKLHIITDGRDTAPHSARDQGYIDQLEALAEDHDRITLVTMSGRYYAMDRDKNWDRIERAYQAMVHGVGFDAADATAALRAAYERGEGDEFVQPSVIGDYEGMGEKDGVLFANFRPDRAREIISALTSETFDGFDRKAGAFAPVVGMADYWSEDWPLDLPALFPMEHVEETLGEVLANAGKRQLRIAETEKYNHVTYFFSGGNAKFSGEDRILIDSPKVATYDMQPEMAAPEVTDKLIDALRTGGYDFVVVNYANPDMVGHTGDMAATLQAIEAVDTCLGRLRETMRQLGGMMLVTADHGNADLMQDKNGHPHTQHTTNPVPLVLDGAAGVHLQEGGRLADIAPTVLSLMGIAQPSAMTGHSLASAAIAEAEAGVPPDAAAHG